MTVRWSETVWEKSLRLYNAILAEPFVKELAAGTLDSSKFARYIAQDECYLGNYGRQMSEFAAMLDDPSEHDLFVAFAESGMEGETQMHQLLIDRFDIDTEVTPSVVTRTYNDHTQKAIDSGSRLVALSALMPCMWIYNSVGLAILEDAELEGNPYREWIEEYGDPGFTQGVKAVVDMMDKWAEDADALTLERMNQAFLSGVLCEYAFWDYGYRGEDGDYDYMHHLEPWI